MHNATLKQQLKTMLVWFIRVYLSKLGYSYIMEYNAAVKEGVDVLCELQWKDVWHSWSVRASYRNAWRIPWREEPGGLQSTGLQRVGQDWATSLTHSPKLQKMGENKDCRFVFSYSCEKKIGKMNKDYYLCIFVDGNKCYFYISTLYILPIKIYIKVKQWF